MTRRLIEALGDVGSDLTAGEVSDAVWLVSQVAQRAARPAPPADDAAPAAAALGGSTSGTAPAPEPDRLVTGVGDDRAQARDAHPAASGEGGRAAGAALPVDHDGQAQFRLPIRGRVLDPPGWESSRSPGADALPEALATARAMRPLHRRVPSWTSVEFDQDATVRRVAEEDVWVPQYRPARDRWLDLVLVVDTSSSMAVWTRRVGELSRLMQRLGAFRRVGSFHFDGDRSDETLELRAGVSSTRHHPGELVDPSGRTAVLVVSDCVGPAWGGASLAGALRLWSKSGPVAVAQTLPQRLWSACEPDLAAVRLRSPRRGAANAELRMCPVDPDAAAGQGGEQAAAVGGAVPVPVLQIDPRWIGPWATLIAEPEPRPVQFTVLLVDDAGMVRAPDRAAALSTTPPQEQVDALVAFREFASTEALELAQRLAAAPLSLSVMELVQRTTPGVGPAALAEVFLGGLLRPAPPEGTDVASAQEEADYEFVHDVRDRLLAGLPQAEQLAVLDRVSTLITEKLGLPRNDFRAFLAGADDAVDVLSGSAPFARVTLRVLAALGGRYREVARRLARSARVRPHVDGELRRLGWDVRAMSEQKSPAQAAVAHGAPYFGEGNNPGYAPVPVGDSLVAVTAAHPAVPATFGSTLASAATPSGGPRVFGAVPFRNSYFTGRVELLERLHTMLRAGASQMALLPHSLHGMGGVGKTQLAIEYAWRFAHEYDLVWWLRAESTTTVRAGLLELATAIGLPQADASKTVLNVLEVLQQRETFPRWLIVFDNANAPEQLHGYLPAFGHVLVTSRDPEWGDVAEQLEVNVFDRDESVALLQRRGAGISAREADGLAAQLGDLPLALDQAAAWQAATGAPVPELQRLLRERMAVLMAEPGPTTYPASLMATWDLAFSELRQHSPGAARLLELLSFFGPDPISIPLLQEAKGAELSEPLGRVLRDEIMLRRAIREIGKYALAKPNASKDDIEIHRLVQAVLREQLTAAERAETRDAVHRVIGAANPGYPDFNRTWARHAELLPHITPADVIHGTSEAGHRAALDQIRYRYNRGDYERSVELADGAVNAWRVSRGDDDELTLIAQRHLATALQELGRYDRATPLITTTWDRMRSVFGVDHEHTLATTHIVGRDLRLQGHYAAALERSQDALERHRRQFGAEDAETLKALNNVAVSQRFLGDANAALENDQRCYDARVQAFGPDNLSTQISLINVGRDLADAGRYSDALTLLREAMPRIQANGALHRNTISAKRTLAITLRRSGATARARELAEEVFRAADRVLGAGNERLLAVMVTYANALLAVGEKAAARSLAERAHQGYAAEFGREHPSTLAAALDLAVVCRALQDRARAAELDRASHESLLAALGEDHPYVLVAKTNLALDLALSNDFTHALELSRDAYERSLRIRGENRPETLICGLNHALDLRATGDSERAADLYERVQVTLRRDYGDQHAASLAAVAGVRADADIEPWET